MTDLHVLTASALGAGMALRLVAVAVGVLLQLFAQIVRTP